MDIEPNDDYAQGQMMGMLVIIQMIDNSAETGTGIPKSTFDKIQRVAVESLSKYLDQPEEDIMLMVDQQLKSV